MDIGLFSFNLNTVLAFLEQPTFTLIAKLFAIFLWVPLVSILLKEAVTKYVEYLQVKKNKDWKFVVLAIDIPQLNIQTPKAVEQLFTHLAAVFSKPDIRAKFREGYKQKWFSFEIVSIEGYIQFVVWTEQQYRDLMETAIYAQYPEAEITEVEDYVGVAPEKYPNEEYDVWAADFGLAENAAFPIRSYIDFEHNISKDTVLKDPMGTMLESFSRIGHGEQMWLQFLVKPIGGEWKKEVIDHIKEYIGEEKPAKKAPLDAIGGNMIVKEVTGLVQEAGRQIAGSIFGGGEGHEEKKENKDKNQLKYMTPGQVKLVEAMEKKIQKIGFKVNIRAVYLGRKEVFNTARGVAALKGSMSQFNIPTANSIVVEKSTSYRKASKTNKKKKKYIAAYKKRKMDLEVHPFVLNIEELATIWHFPMSHVKTPLLQKASSKAAEPPSGLPVEYLPTTAEIERQTAAEGPGKKKIITDSGEELITDDIEYG